MTGVLIVEDIAETRRWLATVGSAAFPRAAITCSSSVREALAAISADPPDIALVDLGLPDGSGLRVVHALRERKPEALCVITTAMGDDANIVAALAAGASGYLLKDQPGERIARQLSHLAEGVPALSPSVARRIMEHFRRTGPITDDDSDLTAREKEVLALISRGLRNSEVAKQLSLAESTVATHLKSVYRKLGISSRAEASWHASRMGLTP